MAENEILDLGHKARWARTRRALNAPGCTQAEVIAAATDDMESVCRLLAIVLRKGKPLTILLGPVLESPSQAQAVLASFTEKRLVSVVRDAIKLARSTDLGQIAGTASRRLIEVLVDQFRVRAGKSHEFRACDARDRLVAEVAKSFAAYEGALRSTIEASLRGGAIRPFKAIRPSKPRMSAIQVIGLSVASSQQVAPSAR